MGFWDFNVWNALRVLLFIYNKSYPPFYDNEPIGIYKKIIIGIIEFPKFFELRAKDLIRKLLNPELKYRLGVSDVIIIYLFLSMGKAF